MIPEKTKPKPGEGETVDLAAFTAMIAELLGCPPETPPKELFAKLKARMTDEPDPAKYMPVAAVQAMLAERNLSLATASEERVAEKVAAALQKGHISPAMKDWATALCRSDMASFDRFVASTGAPFAHLLKSSHAAARAPGATLDRAGSELADAICSQLGLKPGSLAE